MALQFGYSDSGRYVGQLAASYLIERLRLKVADLLVRHGLTGVELMLFDTHGESIGRGAHPGSLLDRLRYLSPGVARQAFAGAGIVARARRARSRAATATCCSARRSSPAPPWRASRGTPLPRVPKAPDPIYEEPDFAADFFTSVGISMQGLVEDPGYAGLLGAFGPALLDPSGSPAGGTAVGFGRARGDTPSARAARDSEQRDPAAARLVREHAAGRGHGGGAQRRSSSPTCWSRARGSAAPCSSPNTRCGTRTSTCCARVVAMIDPGSWLDRAAHARRPGRARALAEVARVLEQLDLWAPAQAMFRRIQADHVRLREAWPDAPSMAIPRCCCTRCASR